MGKNRMMRFLVTLALRFALGAARPAAAQQVRAGREDYDGSITKYGLDLGLTRGSRMLWIVLTNTVAGPSFLAGDYFGATGEATVGAGLGANVLLGGSNRTVALQPLSLSGQTGLNLAVGVAALQLGIPRQ